MSSRRLAYLALMLVLTVSALAAMPIAAQAASYPPQIGTDGGTPFEVTCPAGAVMVGIDYHSDDVITAIAGFCKKVGPDGRVTGKLFGTDGYGGNAGGLGARDPIYCRQDMVITHLAVAINHNHVVRLIEVFCSPTVGGGQGFYVGTSKVGHQAPDQVEYMKETEDCKFGIGLVGAASSSDAIQRLGIKCELIAAPAPPPPPAKPPMDVEDDDGGNGGDATAATDTTVYQQKGIDDDATNQFLASGDVVTIVACTDDGFCEISAPFQGFVWGEDLNR